MMVTQSKLTTLLQSRKFWAMIFGLLTLGVSYQFGHIPLETTELSALGILSAYILGVAIEDGGQAAGQQLPPLALHVEPTSALLPRMDGTLPAQNINVTYAKGGSATPLPPMAPGGRT